MRFLNAISIAIGLACISCLLASRAHAELSVHWSSGGTNRWMSGSSAEMCSLVVCKQPGQVSPPEFILLWIGDGPLAFVGQALDTAGADPVNKAPLVASATSNRNVLAGTTWSADSSVIAVQMGPGFVWDILLVELSGGIPVQANIDLVPRLRVNLGWQGSDGLPALCALPRYEVVGDSMLIIARGIGMNSATGVYVNGYGVQSSAVPFEIVADSLLRFKVRNLSPSAMPTWTIVSRCGSLDRHAFPVPQPPNKTLCVILKSGADIQSIASLPGVDAIRTFSTLGEQLPVAPTDPNILYRPENLEGVIFIDLSPSVQSAAMQEAIQALPSVAYVDEMRRGPIPAGLPNDPIANLQWALFELPGDILCQGQIIPIHQVSIKADELWSLPKSDSPAAIAFIDDGIGLLNPDMPTPAEATFFSTPHFDAFGTGGFFSAPISPTKSHGTIMASIAAAKTGNGRGMSSPLFPQTVEVTPVRAVSARYFDPYAPEDSRGWERVTNCLTFLRTSDQNGELGLGTVNMSFEGPLFPGATRRGVAKGLKNLFLRGFVLVASMGGRYTASESSYFARAYPAAFSELVFAVGASDPFGRVWRYGLTGGPQTALEGTGMGSWLDAVAGGGLGETGALNGTPPLGGSDGPFVSANNNLSVLTPFHCYVPENPHYVSVAGVGGGTSTSAALVSGVCTALRQLAPSILPLGDVIEGDDIRHALELTCRDLGPPAGFDLNHGAQGFDVISGYGQVDAGAAGRLFTPPNIVLHGMLDAGNGLAPLDSVTTVSLAISGVTDIGIDDGTYPATRVRLRGHVDFLQMFPGFDGEPHVWFRERLCLGMPATPVWDDDEQIMRGLVVGDQWTAVDMDLETYVYRLRISETVSRWYPCPPVSARIAWTAAGLAPSLDVAGTVGPSEERTTLRLAGDSNGTLRWTIGWALGAAASIELFDIAGRRVGVFDVLAPAGAMSGTISLADIGGSLLSGLYLAKFSEGTRTARAKCFLHR